MDPHFLWNRALADLPIPAWQEDYIPATSSRERNVPASHQDFLGSSAAVLHSDSAWKAILPPSVCDIFSRKILWISKWGSIYFSSALWFTSLLHHSSQKVSHIPCYNMGFFCTGKDSWFISMPPSHWSQFSAHREQQPCAGKLPSWSELPIVPIFCILCLFLSWGLYKVTGMPTYPHLFLLLHRS